MATTRATVCEVMARSAARFGPRPALRWKVDGSWHTLSWAEYLAAVRRTARGLIALGLAPGERVCILGRNRPEWVLGHLATMFAGGISVGIYPTASREQCEAIARDAGAAILLVENPAALARFEEFRRAVEGPRATILMEGDAPGTTPWAEVQRAAEGVAEPRLDERLAAQGADDVCTLIYTSGTTGEPKGVLLTHDNVTWTMETTARTWGLAEDDVYLSYLPLNHIAEQGATIYLAFMAGYCVYFAEGMEALIANVREVRPTIFLGVPRVWEKIHEGFARQVAGSPWLRRSVLRLALAAMLRSWRGGTPDGGRTLGARLAHALVLRRIHEKLGVDRARLVGSAAAPLSQGTAEFFLSLGMLIYDIYGMSECTGPVAIPEPARFRVGTVGTPLPGTEMRTAEDGEICVRGRHVFRGYWGDDEGTRASFAAGGWFRTGDIGHLDAEGFLRITGRKKDIIITAGGENVAPQHLEALLEGIRGVRYAVVAGDRRRYLVALLTLDDAEDLRWLCTVAGSTASTAAEAARCPAVRAHLQAAVDGVNQRLARVQTIKRFRILDTQFTIDGGELTPTLKVRRHRVYERHARDIEALYEDDGHEPAGSRRPAASVAAGEPAAAG